MTTTFVPQKRHLREALLFLFHLKKKASQAHQMLVEAYDKRAPSERTCREWFQRFKSGDFDVNDKDREGTPKKFKNEELQALLDEDSARTQKQLAASLNISQQAISLRLHAMGKIKKKGKRMPCKLKGTKSNEKRQVIKKRTTSTTQKGKDLELNQPSTLTRRNSQCQSLPTTSTAVTESN